MATISPIFALLRLALGTSTEASVLFSLTKADWEDLVDLSFKQGVAAIAVDGLQYMYDRQPDLELALDLPELEALKYEWFRYSMTVEQEYNTYVGVLERLVAFFHNHNIPIMLLKGYGLSLNYPIPAHRPPGDIDIYLWNNWRLADQLVSEVRKILVDNSHHHHSVFQFEGITVENHYDFINIHSHTSNKVIEDTFKRLAESKDNAILHILPEGNKVFFPSPNLNALFISRHCAIHFAADKMNIRQLLDWVLFVKLYHNEVNWKFYWDEIKKMGMQRFVLCINAIAVENLGFKSELFHTPVELENFSAREPFLVKRVLDDILSPVATEPKDKVGILYIWSRLKNWWRNRWKHRMVYSDSLLITFFVQIKSHIMKPATIFGKKKNI